MKRSPSSSRSWRCSSGKPGPAGSDLNSPWKRSASISGARTNTWKKRSANKRATRGTWNRSSARSWAAGPCWDSTPRRAIAPTSPDGEESYHAHAMRELLRLAEQTPSAPVIVDSQWVERELRRRSIGESAAAENHEDSTNLQEGA